MHSYGRQKGGVEELPPSIHTPAHTYSQVVAFMPSSMRISRPRPVAKKPRTMASASGAKATNSKGLNAAYTGQNCRPSQQTLVPMHAHTPTASYGAALFLASEPPRPYGPHQ